MTLPHCGVSAFCTALGLSQLVAPGGGSGTHSGCQRQRSFTWFQLLTGWYPVVSA